LRILACTDDRYRAAGIRVWTDARRAVTVGQAACPTDAGSGGNHALTLDSPLQMRAQANGKYPRLARLPAVSISSFTARWKTGMSG